MGHVERAGAQLRVVLDQPERGLLKDVVESMLELLEGGGREDPALRRLFVDAYESKEEAQAFHELVDDDLQRNKVAALRFVAGALAQPEIVFDETQTEDWLRALNDARLAIGARLEVTEEIMGGELDKADPNSPTLALLHWLGWLQESTLEALSRTL